MLWIYFHILVSLALGISCSTWLFHTWSFENFSFTKSVGSIVQVSEDAVLSFEQRSIGCNRFLVVWIQIDWVWSREVPNLSYAKFVIAHLFVQKARFHFMRVNVCIPSNDIMVHTAPIVECFANDWPCCVEWFHGVCPTGLLSITIFDLLLFLFLLLFVLHSVIVRHPVVGSLHIVAIFRLGHHEVIDFLLGSCIGWRLITYIISFISW